MQAFATMSTMTMTKKIILGNANCSAPKTVIGVTKVRNERYLPYVQLCGKADKLFFCEFHVLKVYKWPKARLK